MKKRNWMILGCFLAVVVLLTGAAFYFRGREKETNDTAGDVPGHYIGETEKEEEIDIEADVESRKVKRQKGDHLDGFR